MTYQCFDVSITNRIAHVVLNRPDKRNNMIRAFWDELPRIIHDIDGQSRARVIVISSTGPHFSSGIDTGMFADNSIAPGPDAQRAARLQHGARFYDHVLDMQRTFTALEQCRIPVLAAIQGGCIGGGVDLVTACDIRYATEDAFITIFETNMGMTADVGTFPRLVKLIPEGDDHLRPRPWHSRRSGLHRHLECQHAAKRGDSGGDSRQRGKAGGRLRRVAAPRHAVASGVDGRGAAACHAHTATHTATHRGRFHG